MHIIVVYDFGFVNGGAAQVAISSALALKAAGHHVTYLCAVGPVDDRLRASCDQVLCTDQQDIGSDQNLFRKSVTGLWNRKARKLLRSLLTGFDANDTIVHFHGWSKALSPAVLDVPRQMGFAACITLHDYFCVCPNGGLFDYQTNTKCHLQPMSGACLRRNCDRDCYANKVWRYVRNKIQDRHLKHAAKTALIAISDTSARAILQTGHLNNPCLTRINNPIVFPTASRAGRDEADTYLFMGRLSKEKGPALFCQALTDLGLKGVVLGEGPLKAELAAQYPAIEFAGWVEEVGKDRYLSRCRALIFPSVLMESFGMSVAEMLSAGIPCIVATGTAASELIEDGRNGVLFESGNLESLKAAIRRFEKIYQDLADFTFLTASYAMPGHLSELMALYNRLLQRDEKVE